ncbi:restriction endonuclease subunit S [Tenacibaculum dicentrarchi]|nr:restriction endonuclease subunit S [Tenacibaculum dicentrarchi]
MRFRGFSEEWEENFVEDLCSISTGNSNTQDNVKDGQYPFYVRSATIEKSNKYLFDEEAVLTVGDGVGTGKVYHYVNGKYDLHQRVYRMYDFIDVKGKLFYYIFSENFQERVSSMTAKSSVDSVRMEMISKMKISRPNKLEEQTKIGSFFENLDQLLTKHQTQHQKLQALKKAMLGKLFPKKGATTPEIRFKGFTDNWEVLKLGEITNTTIGEFVIKTRQNPNYPYAVFNGGKSNTGFYDDFNNEGEKILISARGANAGFVNVINERFWCGNSCYSVEIKNDDLFDLYFLYTYIKNNQNRFIENQQAANIPSVSKSDVESFIIQSPYFKEQQQIGNYFKNLDALITKHATQIEKLGAIKKACLSKMFV